MNKRWISLLLAALMLLSLLPTAFAAQQPDGAQIDTAALAARMNRSDSVRLSETASPKQSAAPAAAAKTADESKPNEIYPHPSQDGMGVVLGDVARIDYSMVIRNAIMTIIALSFSAGPKCATRTISASTATNAPTAGATWAMRNAA